MTERKSPGADDLPDHLPRWLEMAQRRMNADLAAGGIAGFPELRGSHQRLLQMVPPQGIRITDMAALAGMTKQSLGEFVDWLEQSGFVSSGRDPSDGRVRLVLLTDRGKAAVAESQRVIDAVERQWRERVGAARYDVMKEVLRELGRDAVVLDRSDRRSSAGD